MMIATDPGSKRIWIAWQDHRRTRELADALGVKLFVFRSHRPYLVKVAVLAVRTIWTLLALRPELVIVQNPSIVLAALAGFFSRLIGYRLVVDRHSNFKLPTLHSRAPKWKLFHALSRYSVRRAQLTIVTNDYLKRIVEQWGGRGFVLPDRIPRLDLARRVDLERRPAIVYVCSFGNDEPVAAVIAAARLLEEREDLQISITGDHGRAAPGLRDNLPGNVRLTGYLSERRYQSLLASCDVVMVLTTAPHLLVCGAYEAVSLGKPLITSDQPEIRSHFTRGTVLTDNSAQDLARAMTEAVARSGELAAAMTALKPELEKRWRDVFALLREELERLERA
jgi:glycosyltransferase involved in cell wall biosynthesis